MEKICFDTDILIDFLRGESTTVEKVKHYSDEELCATTHTLFELLVSVRKPEIVKQLIKNITPLSFNENSGIIAARIYNELRENGMLHPVRNIITAAICIDQGAYLVTKNRADYEGIKGLKLV